MANRFRQPRKLPPQQQLRGSDYIHVSDIVTKACSNIDRDRLERELAIVNNNNTGRESPAAVAEFGNHRLGSARPTTGLSQQEFSQQRRGFNLCW